MKAWPRILWFFPSLVFLSGCAKKTPPEPPERVLGLGFDYSRIFRRPPNPQSAQEVRLVHDGANGRKTVWPNLPQQGPIVGGTGLVAFLGAPADLRLKSPLRLFLVQNDSPVVEVTDLILVRALKGRPAAGLQPVRVWSEGRTAVLFEFAPEGKPEDPGPGPISITLTWPEVRELVELGRKSGTPVVENGVAYFRLPAPPPP